MVVAIRAGAPHPAGILATEIPVSLLFREGAEPLAVITRSRDLRAFDRHVIAIATGAGDAGHDLIGPAVAVARAFFREIGGPVPVRNRIVGFGAVQTGVVAIAAIARCGVDRIANIASGRWILFGYCWGTVGERRRRQPQGTDAQ